MYLLAPQRFYTCTTCTANTSKSIVFCIAECIVSILIATMKGWSVKHDTKQQDCLVKQRLSKSNMPLCFRLCEHIMPQHTLCTSGYKLFIIIKCCLQFAGIGNNTLEWKMGWGSGRLWWFPTLPRDLRRDYDVYLKYTALFIHLFFPSIVPAFQHFILVKWDKKGLIIF